MYETKWYARGETGEHVLSIVESLLDGAIHESLAVRELKFLGLSEEEVQEVLRKQCEK